MDEKTVNKCKFVIVSPRQHHGGPIVLHYLCKLLEEKGIESKILYIGPNIYIKHKKLIFWAKWVLFNIWDTGKVMLYWAEEHITKLLPGKKAVLHDGYTYNPVKGCKRKFLPFVDKNTIVVYPEIVYGNFLGAKNVIRWLLYHNRYSGDSEAFGASDLVIAYREVFNDKNLNPEEYVVTLPYFDRDLYRQTNFEPREGSCYIIRKGRNRNDLPSTFSGPIIDDYSEHEKVAAFNQFKYCILYDTQTAYASIASACGCIPIVIPEEGKQRRDYLSANEHDYGVAYGDSPEEIAFAINTRKEVIVQWDRKIEEANKNIDYFLEICRQKFPELPFK